MHRRFEGYFTDQVQTPSASSLLIQAEGLKQGAVILFGYKTADA